MRFEKEVWYRYHQVHGMAQKEARKAEKMGLERCPKELKYQLENKKIANTVELGTVEIPVNQIVGTAVFDEKNLYSPNFLPISSTNSPFAEQWCQLYMDYLSDKGWDAPIRCFEFLGRFYVQDGKKRVSVLKAHGATVTEAIVTRIMPVITTSSWLIMKRPVFIRSLSPSLILLLSSRLPSAMRLIMFGTMETGSASSLTCLL